MSDRLLGRMIKKELAGNMGLALAAINVEAQGLQQRANDLVKGRQVRIISNWNGQPWGRSRKSMKGKVFTVRGAGLDPHWGAYLWLEGERLSIRATEVEWL